MCVVLCVVCMHVCDVWYVYVLCMGCMNVVFVLYGRVCGVRVVCVLVVCVCVCVWLAGLGLAWLLAVGGLKRHEPSHGRCPQNGKKELMPCSFLEQDRVTPCLTGH